MSGPTREQVRAALARGQRRGGSQLDEMMALLADTAPEVLAEVPTVPQLVVMASDKSMVFAVDLPVPVGTRVAVVGVGESESTPAPDDEEADDAG